MSAEIMREAFERHFSEDGKYPRAVERSSGRGADGAYRLMATYSGWNTWQAAWGAALALVAEQLVTVPEVSRSVIEIADTVHHKQTGEDWIVGRVDDGYVYPCGWPCCRALLEDFTLIKKASEAERASLIESLRRLPSSDPRHISVVEAPR